MKPSSGTTLLSYWGLWDCLWMIYDNVESKARLRVLDRQSQEIQTVVWWTKVTNRQKVAGGICLAHRRIQELEGCPKERWSEGSEFRPLYGIFTTL